MTRTQRVPSARFDDLRPDGSSFELTDPGEVFVALVPDEVAPVVAAAEAAAQGGLWVAGFVTYEAAAGLDGRATTADWPAAHPLSTLPLAWFATFGERREVDRIDPPATFDRPRWQLDRDERWHRAAVESVRAGIAAGEYYQVNLTARATAIVPDVDQMYAATANAQRGGYNAVLRTGEFTIASASPELFFDLHDGELSTRPMKGTARRGRWPSEDRLQAQQLWRSAKERAENAMIVDLMRNDLARVARTGTVRVTSLFDVERYPTLWQLTSTVRAAVRTDVGLLEVFRALFPSGSITGAPKGSATAAIAALEQRARGVYCGAIGYLEPGRPARAQFSVAIRTVTAVDATGYAEYGVGGGITWSSDPDQEWQELQTKTRVLDTSPVPSALLETMRFDGRGVRNLARHLQRLTDSADYFGFVLDRADLENALDDALRAGAGGRARVRLLLHADGGLHVDVADLPPAADTVRLGLAAQAVRSDDITLFHKGADRTRYTAFRAAHPDVDDVVLHNESGEVTETTIANLAARLDGRWLTPPLRCGLLPGVERARLLDEGVLTERVMTVEDLRRADQLAVFSSLRGWRTAYLTQDILTSC